VNRPEKIRVLPRGRSHKTRRFRGVTYPESYITKYTKYTKINLNAESGAAVQQDQVQARNLLAEKPGPGTPPALETEAVPSSTARRICAAATERGGINLNRLKCIRTEKWPKPNPESGLDCLRRAEFARQRA